MQVIELPVDQLNIHPLRLRQALNQVQLMQLADLLRAQGFWRPILVNRGLAGYQVILGERFWRAAKLAGLKQIPCAVVSGLSQESALFLMLAEALGQEPISIFDLAAGLKKLRTEYQIERSVLAEKLGLGIKDIGQFEQILTLPTGVKKAYLQGDLTSKQIFKLAQSSDLAESLADMQRFLEMSRGLGN